eukprot:7322-Pleurochrysis_carterae.AAC.1
MRSESKYGEFKPPHLRHEMALHACRDMLFYANARLDPLVHLPKFTEYISMEHRRDFTSHMTSQKRNDLK